MECPYHEGTNSLPAVVARLLPNSTYGWVPWYAAYERDALGRTTNVTATYSTGYDVWPLTRTRQYVYNGSDLATVIGPQDEILAGYGYTNHLVIRATNAVGDVTSYTWDPQERLTSVKTPAGLTRTNLYFASGTYTNFVQTAIDLEISRTNSFTYTNGLVSTHTDERGLTTTSLYDNLNRLTNSANSLGAISTSMTSLTWSGRWTAWASPPPLPTMPSAAAPPRPTPWAGPPCTLTAPVVPSIGSRTPPAITLTSLTTTPAACSRPCIPTITA